VSSQLTYNTEMVSIRVMVKSEAGRGVSARFSEAGSRENQVTIAETAPEPFCGFRWSWYTPS
jgi:hypothetical protein